MAAPRGQFSGQLDGIEGTLNVFKKYAEGAEAAADSEMADWADEVWKVSQTLVPVSQTASDMGEPSYGPGFLKDNSGVSRNGPGDYSVYYNAWYAIYVHEILRHHEVGQWQFLSTAVAQVLPQMSKEAGNKFFSTLSGNNFESDAASFRVTFPSSRDRTGTSIQRMGDVSFRE